MRKFANLNGCGFLFKELSSNGDWVRKWPQMLLDFLPKKAGYKKVRLDTASQRKKQFQAIEFYKTGPDFTAIERYNESLCTVFMEKEL